MIADLLRDEGKSKSLPARRVADHPWRLSVSLLSAVIFLAIGLCAPQLPTLFPHMRLGWMLACFLLTISAMSMTTSNLPLRLLSAAIGALLAYSTFHGLIQYNLISDTMAYHVGQFPLWEPGSILGTGLLSLMVAFHCVRIERHLNELSGGQRERVAVGLALLQSTWLTLVIVALLFAGPMIAKLDAPDLSGKWVMPSENPWFLLAIGGSLLVGGIGSGLLVGLLPTRSWRTHGYGGDRRMIVGPEEVN